jgi:ABC-type transporter Mla MlaB component
MSDSDSERFAASLTANQRQYLLRLFDGCLGDAEDPLRWRPLIALQARLHDSCANDSRPPYLVEVTVPGQAVVVVSRRILNWPGVWEPAAQAWLDELKITTLTVDVSSLDEMNSASIAWLVTLAQHLPGSAVRLIGVNDTIRRSLRVLHLDRVLIIDG